MGGIGAERQVSLDSGTCVADALERAGLSVVRADVTPDDLEVLNDSAIDVFFLALHGTFGEDGCIQEILEQRGLCYTGSGPDACRLAFDKVASKTVFKRIGISTPAVLVVKRDEEPESLLQRVQQLGSRWVVKPIRQGSSVGVHIVDELDQVLTLCHEVVEAYQDCMIEPFVAGREITVAVVQGRALPVIEIRACQPFYDYQAKYVDETTDYLFETLAPALEQEARTWAERGFTAFGLRDFARVDFLVTDSDELVVLEFNTIPGMTTHSLVPKASARAGIEMPELCARIVTAAYQRRPSVSVSRIEC